MKITVKITKLLFCAIFLFAFNTDSDAQLEHTMIFRVNSPAANATDYNSSGPASGGAGGQWGPTHITTVTGDLAWITDGTDSLGCFPATNSLTNKIALVRRGACNFTTKASEAETAGAIGCVICNHTPGAGLVNMSAGAPVTVGIPIVFLTYEDCELLHSNIDTGGTTNVSFYVPSAYDAVSSYAFNTPQQHIQDISNMNITLYNESSTPINNINVTTTFSDPNSNDTTFSQTIATLNGQTDSVVTFTDVYTPSAVGEYTVTFTSNLGAGDTVVQNFFINNDSTFALDNNDLSLSNSSLRGVGPADADFAAAHPVTGTTFQYGMGACYITGIGSSDYATTATFALENANTYIGKMLLVLLYEAPVNYFAGTETDFSTFNEIGAGFYNITAADTLNPHSLMTTSILDASTGAPGLQLQADRHYMLVLRHDGDGSITAAPRISTTHSEEYLSVDATVYLDQLYMGGWVSKYMPVIRMHVQSSMPTSVETRNLLPSEFMVFPNPTDENISVKVNLEEVSEKVSVKLFDLNGKELQSHNYENVQNDIYHYNVCELPAGVYLMHVQTDFAQTVRKVIVK